MLAHKSAHQLEKSDAVPAQGSGDKLFNVIFDEAGCVVKGDFYEYWTAYFIFRHRVVRLMPRCFAAASRFPAKRLRTSSIDSVGMSAMRVALS